MTRRPIAGHPCRRRRCAGGETPSASGQAARCSSGAAILVSKTARASRPLADGVAEPLRGRDSGVAGALDDSVRPQRRHAVKTLLAIATLVLVLSSTAA